MTTSNTAKQVAATILTQLGGHRFIAMPGSNNFSYGTTAEGNDCFVCHLTKNKSTAKYLSITLMVDDTYTMKFSKTNKAYDIIIVNETAGVYYDQLQDIFTEVTGLNTSLGTMCG